MTSSSCTQQSCFLPTSNLNQLTQAELRQLSIDTQTYANSILDIRSEEEQTLNQQIGQVQQLILDLEQEEKTRNLNRTSIQTRLGQLQDQETDLNRKTNLIQTRDRMLQIAMDKNVYKQKLIYILLSVIFCIFILSMIGYVLYKRYGGNNGGIQLSM